MISSRAQDRSTRAQAQSPVPPEKKSAARPRISAFHFVVAGSSVSMMGTKISTLAFPLLILWLGGSPTMAGLAVFATVMPGMLLYFPAGVIVDKRDPRRMMLLSEISRGLVAIAIIVSLLIFGQHVKVYLLIPAVFAEEVLEIFSTLADRRYLNLLMGPDKNGSGRSRQASIEARVHAATLAGRPVAPLLFTLSPLFPFLADAISFVFSVASLLIKGNEHREDSGPSEGAEAPGLDKKSHSIGEIIGRVRGDHWIWLGGPLMAMTSMVSQALILVFLTEAQSHHFSTLMIGIVLAASGLGGAIGSYCSKVVPSHLGRWLPIQLVFWCVSFLGLALTGGRSDLWDGSAMFVLSFTGAIGNVELSTYLNKRFFNGMLGRITGIGYAISIGACALGPVVGGFAVQRRGVQGAVNLLLFIVVVIALVSLFMFRRPRYEKCEKYEKQAGLAAEESVASAEAVADVDSLLAATVSSGIPDMPSKAHASVRSPSVAQCNGQISLVRDISVYVAGAAVRCRQRAFILASKESTRVDR